MRKRGLYGQTVTVYHPVPMKKRVDRYVLRDVFCQIGSREVPDAAGTKSGAAMLLVVTRLPGPARLFGFEPPPMAPWLLAILLPLAVAALLKAGRRER